MAKNYKEINSGSRTALVKSSNLYGGQILTTKITDFGNVGQEIQNSYYFGYGAYSYEIQIKVKPESNGNGAGGPVVLTFRALDWDGSSADYYELVSINGELIIGDEETIKDVGRFYYNVGEEIYINTDFIKDVVTIKAVVTSIYPDRNYGYSFNHQILYDRFDRKMYIKIINDDGSEELIDFNGAPYSPTVLPDQTSFVSYTRISSTEILFNYNNSPVKVLSASVSNDDLTIYRTSIFQNSIRVLTEENIQYGTTYQFNLTFIDNLGTTINDSININITDPGGTGEDWGFGSYIAWTGSPYFLDESYHMVLYTSSDLINMGLDQGTGVISRIGFPFHLVSGQGDNLSNADIEDGSFVLAASIIGVADMSTIDSKYIKDNYIVDNEFDTKILNVNSSKLPGIVETYNGQRYVFFQISHFHWDFRENLLITYWMDGPQPASGGWNGGYITSGNGVQEVLGFNNSNDWNGLDGVSNEKVALAFTTLR